MKWSSHVLAHVHCLWYFPMTEWSHNSSIPFVLRYLFCVYVFSTTFYTLYKKTICAYFNIMLKCLKFWFYLHAYEPFKVRIWIFTRLPLQAAPDHLTLPLWRAYDMNVVSAHYTLTLECQLIINYYIYVSIEGSWYCVVIGGSDDDMVASGGNRNPLYAYYTNIYTRSNALMMYKINI